MIHDIRGFDELGGSDDFSANVLACLLGKYGILDALEEEEMDEDVLKSKGINNIRIHKQVRGGRLQTSRYGSGDVDDYD